MSDEKLTHRMEFGPEKLPKERSGITHHFEILSRCEDGTLKTTDGYLIANNYPDGRLGEVFIRIAKESDAMGPILDQWAMSFSIALQNGADAETLCRKYVGSRFEPSGATKNPNIPRCTSPLDYICCFLLEMMGKPVKVQR